MLRTVLISFFVLTLVFIGLTIFTNQNLSKNKDLVTLEKKETHVASPVQPEQSKAVFIINDSLTDMARFIAGMKPEKTPLFVRLSKDTTWKAYAAKINAQWNKIDSTKFSAMKKWTGRELGKFNTEKYNLFYPFSGPDYLNASIFFPASDTMVLVGLEPVGTLPDFTKPQYKDSLRNYLSGIKTSLTSILNFSFFITKHMFKDLRRTELNGTIHVMLWFAARTGDGIISVDPVSISRTGKLQHHSSLSDTAYQHSKNKGVCIRLAQNGNDRHLYYFSADISNYGLNKNQPFIQYLSNINYKATFVKSASYLMHSNNFSKIRDLIMLKSNYILEDDTGIPFRFFADNKDWNFKLYGHYQRPIQVFSQQYQDDLKRAYDSLEVHKLDFGIGYKYRKDESTFMLFEKKQSSAPLPQQ